MTFWPLLFYVSSPSLVFCTLLHKTHLTWSAPFLSGGGYSSEALSLTKSLHATSPQVSLLLEQHGDSYNSAYVTGLPISASTFLRAHMHTPLPPSSHVSISVCHSEPGAWHFPPLHPRRYSTAACPEASAHYTVGRTMFESDRLPSGWEGRLNAMDEVWVPTAFMRDIMVAGGVEASKLVVLGEPVDAAGEFSPENGAAAAASSPHLPPRRCGVGVQKGSSPACPYRFLSVGKWERRKGFDALLSAYVSAFSKGGSSSSSSSSTSSPPYVELYILTSSYHGTDDFAAAVTTMITQTLACKGNTTRSSSSTPPPPPPPCLTPTQSASPPPIILLTAIPQVSLPGVFASVDACVQASRGEGWGRPHVECMAMGLPLVATAWGGPGEYMRESNSFPLGHTHLAALPEEEEGEEGEGGKKKKGPFAGHRFAEPNVTQLRGFMVELVGGEGGGQEEGVRRGAQARKDMLEKYSEGVLGAVLAGHVARITEKVAAAGEWGGQQHRGVGRARRMAAQLEAQGEAEEEEEEDL